MKNLISLIADSNIYRYLKNIKIRKFFSTSFEAQISLFLKEKKRGSKEKQSIANNCIQKGIENNKNMLKYIQFFL